MQVLKTSEDLENFLRESHDMPVVIFKHSATCPFSARAQEQVANAKHDIKVGCMVVQYAPELKQEVSDRLGVEHKSPQAIVVSKGKAISDYWRGDIQEDTLIEEVNDLFQRDHASAYEA